MSAINPERHDVLIGVIVLDYNDPTATKQCIDSVKSCSNVRCYVVNNGSRVEGQYSSLPDSIIIENECNLGFSAGMNIGIRRAMKDGCNYFVLMNNDCIATPAAIPLLISALDSDPSLGLVAPNRRWSGLADSPKQNFSAITNSKNYDQQDSLVGHSPEISHQESLTGFCLATRLDILVNVGPLDEDFFFGKEDDELSFRILSRGYWLGEVKNSIIRHRLNGSINFESEESLSFLVYHSSRGRALLAKKMKTSPFLQLVGSFFDTFRVLVKSLLLRKKFLPSLMRCSFEGFLAGLRLEVTSNPSNRW